MRLLLSALTIAVALIMCLLVWRLYVLNGEVASLRKTLNQQSHTLARLDSALTAAERQIIHLKSEIAIAAPTPGPRASDDEIMPKLSGIIGRPLNWNSVVQLTGRRGTNEELDVVPLSLLRETLGKPVEVFGEECSPPTNPEFASLLTTTNVGPFNVRMLRPAAESLTMILARVKEDAPSLYQALGNRGSFCARGSRPNVTIPSRHSYGIAVDIAINDMLDQPGDQLTQAGLARLAEYFFEHGWVWGASFGVEDSMHFEVGKKLFEKWRDAGEFQ